MAGGLGPQNSEINKIQEQLSNKEDAFLKKSAFNKDFGVLADTVAEGNHTHNLSDLNNDENFISGIDNITEIPNRSYLNLQDLPENPNLEFHQNTKKLTFTDDEGNTTLIDFKKELESQLKTTNTISFDWNYIYGSASSPLSGALSIDNTNARIGYIQKIYHDDSTAPPFPASFKIQGVGEYLENANAEGLVNTIFVEWTSSTRQIYWITQEKL